MITLLLPLALAIGGEAGARVPSEGREYEGKWYIADTTDNNTGERQVYAFVADTSGPNPTFADLWMRCSQGKPTIFVDWRHLPFADQNVISIYAEVGAPARPVETAYVFSKSKEITEDGLRASAVDSAKIAAAFATSSLVTITAHLSSGSRNFVVDVTGAAGAWSRVSRHCPAPILPRPPV